MNQTPPQVGAPARRRGAARRLSFDVAREMSCQALIPMPICTSVGVTAEQNTHLLDALTRLIDIFKHVIREIRTRARSIVTIGVQKPRETLALFLEKLIEIPLTLLSQLFQQTGDESHPADMHYFNVYIQIQNIKRAVSIVKRDSVDNKIEPFVRVLDSFSSQDAPEDCLKQFFAMLLDKRIEHALMSLDLLVGLRFNHRQFERYIEDIRMPLVFPVHVNHDAICLICQDAFEEDDKCAFIHPIRDSLMQERVCHCGDVNEHCRCKNVYHFGCLSRYLFASAAYRYDDDGPVTSLSYNKCPTCRARFCEFDIQITFINMSPEKKRIKATE